jgi:hypothetical protein
MRRDQIRSGANSSCALTFRSGRAPHSHRPRRRTGLVRARAYDWSRGKPITALAGAQTAEAIVPAVEHDDRYPGRRSPGGPDVVASRCRHCARAARSQRGDPFPGKRLSTGRARHTSRCGASSRSLAIPSPSADVESRVQGHLLTLVVREAEQAPATLAWLQRRSCSSSAPCWCADSSATPGECGRLDTRATALLLVRTSRVIRDARIRDPGGVLGCVGGRPVTETRSGAGAVVYIGEAGG